MHVLAEWDFGPLAWKKTRMQTNGLWSTSYALMLLMPFTNSRASLQLQLHVFDEP